MNGFIIATLIVQIILSLILVVVVLFQSGNQQGLSGSIAGGAETFFGKNKGRTIDAKLKKWTSVVAILFLITSILLSFLVSQEQKANAVTSNAGASIPLDATITTPVDGDVVPNGSEIPDEPVVPEVTE
ncbi:MAG: preprotein translocase subunit SecG [Clostridia bacterium]|nr:preprotein translocase subunit SecG [Clostridia bacterium]